uniref:Uncharacterized protein n=1 Tax=Oncorhynchus mykiss TaxID=8022 RepID=A0A8C7RVY3_ONCMY
MVCRSVWKDLTGLQRALTSTPSHTFGMNWNTDCEPTSVPDLTNTLVVEWKQYFFVDIFPDQMMIEEQNLLYSKLLCELLNKHLSIAPNRYRTRMLAYTVPSESIQTP